MNKCKNFKKLNISLWIFFSLPYRAISATHDLEDQLTVLYLRGLTNSSPGNSSALLTLLMDHNWDPLWRTGEKLTGIYGLSGSSSHFTSNDYCLNCPNYGGSQESDRAFFGWWWLFIPPSPKSEIYFKAAIVKLLLYRTNFSKKSFNNKHYKKSV